jgi:hypothetical protein
VRQHAKTPKAEFALNGLPASGNDTRIETEEKTTERSDNNNAERRLFICPNF